METLVLDRHPSEIYGTFGHLYWDGDEICVTGELPWFANHPKTSCIPIGTYLCIKHNSPNHPDTWEVTNVPNRSNILLHPLNIPIKESEGCIGVGRCFGRLDGCDAIMHSDDAMNDLRDELPDSFYLKIIQSTEPFEIGEE